MKKYIFTKLEDIHSTRAMIWVPFYHDLGLISLLSTLYCGCSMFVLDPISFILNPLLWPDILERKKINVTAAPDFSYSLTARKIRAAKKKYDLSSLFYAQICAEPIHQSTVDAILNDWKLDKSVIFHAYGMAETCLWMTWSNSEFDEETGVACCGTLTSTKNINLDIVIADKGTCLEMPDGETGDVFVKGVSVVKGYFHNEAKQVEFQFEIKDHGENW